MDTMGKTVFGVQRCTVHKQYLDPYHIYGKTLLTLVNNSCCRYSASGGLPLSTQLDNSQARGNPMLQCVDVAFLSHVSISVLTLQNYQIGFCCQLSC